MDKNNVTMADVAQFAKVSKMTVSRALNGQDGVSEDTRQRIIEAADQLGYVQIGGFRTNSPAIKSIGLLVPFIHTSYMGEILNGVCSAAERLNCGLMLYMQGPTTAMERPERHLSLLNNNMIDGVLMIIPRNFEAIVDDVQARRLPYVIIDHHGSTHDEPSVIATNRRGILDAMRHLLALQHQRIGFITGRMDIACSHQRLQGYRDGLAEAKAPFDPELVREGDYSQPSGFHHAQALLQLADPPTAIIASNDVMAFGAMDAAKEEGFIIGHDISIVGFDDIHMAAEVYPALTTVRQPMAEMGETALELLVTLLEGRPTLSVRRELPTELIVRDSTGRNPNI
jgi:LacI family transcriptional regulator